MQYLIRSRARLMGGLICGLMSYAASVMAAPPASSYGTFERPFAPNSLWNSQPVDPVLGTFEIPKSSYYPMVGGGAFSTGVFRAKATDRPQTILPPAGAKGVWDPDAEAFQPSVTIAHWPLDVLPASASDGHADIVDEAAGVIHSFWQLRNDNGTWRATQYAWTRLDGRGWADPAHYFQGARAAGVATSAGLIRKGEIDDGDTQYRHALALSLTYNGLAANPSYVFPATSGDSGAESQNSGQIPEGALLMLPADFDTNRLATPKLRKVAETLKTYGARVVDRNTGTPFVIYVENGASYNLHNGGWNNAAANDLDLLRRSLRPLVSASSWRGADGVCFNPSDRLNLLALRGGWARQAGGNATARYDSAQRALVVEADAAATTLRNSGNRAIQPVHWARPKKGGRYELRVQATGGLTFKLDLTDDASGRVVYSSGYLRDGDSVAFDWPAASFKTTLYVDSVAGRGGRLSASLIGKP